MAILRLSARVMVMVCLPPGVNGANHRCMSSLKKMTKRIIVFKGDVTRDDSQRHNNTALQLMLAQCCNNSKQSRNKVATLCFIKIQTVGAAT